MSQFTRILSTGLVSGYVGIKIMDPVTIKLQALASEEDKRREREASPGVAYDVAARKISTSLGLQLSEEQASLAASGFHYGLGLSAGVLYVFLRRIIGMGPVSAGLAVVLLLWGGVDEGVNTLFGFSAPPAAYPLATHLRGLAGHLALALGVAVTAESLRPNQ